MLRSLPAILLLIAVALAGCARSEEESTHASMSSSASPPVHDSALLIDATAQPTDGPCPYLDNEFVAQTNGQRVTSTGIDERFDTPACVFWSYGETPQLEVIIRHTDSPAAARDVVNWAAPVDTTSPADLPEGWSGGRSGGADGAVYAVSKDTVAVVVRTDQAESVKAQFIAEEAIANLGL